jgi:hypothetical protein
MNTLVQTLLDNQFFLVIPMLALLAAGIWLRQIAGGAGALIERRWGRRAGRG